MDIPPDKFISICSGAGGLDIGIKRGSGNRVLPVCYVENELTAASILATRMEEARLPAAPIWTDITTFDFSAWKGVEGIAGGYPCTPFAHNGKRLGTSDSRFIWTYIARGIETIRPIWCFFENVPTHLGSGFIEVSKDLFSLGYEVAATLVSAQEVGASHDRERLFVLAVERSALANANKIRNKKRVSNINETSRSGSYVDISYNYPPRPQSEDWRKIPANLQPSLPKSEFRRVVNGVGDRVDLSRIDRITILGNGVVPNQAAYAWIELWNELSAGREGAFRV